MRRSERIQKKHRQPIIPVRIQEQQAQEAKRTEEAGSLGRGFFTDHYRKLMTISFVFLAIAFILIGIHFVQTGDVINRGVSLKGGVLITIPTTTLDGEELANTLMAEFPGVDIEGRALEEAGSQMAITLTTDLTPDRQDDIDRFLVLVEKETGVKQDDLSIETIGSSLGASFFQQALKALFIAFIFMGAVVFLYFGESVKHKVIAVIATVIAGLFMYSGVLTLHILAIVIGIALIVLYTRESIPSIAVILAAFSDMVMTIAVVNLMGIKISTAGIAAFLMLIGYSVDTDILLSTRVLKHKTGTINDRIVGAVKTGLTMNITAMAAAVIAIIFAQSPVITQIMTIILIGLFADMLNTWFQNAGILVWYLKHKEKIHKRLGKEGAA